MSNRVKHKKRGSSYTVITRSAELTVFHDDQFHDMGVLTVRMLDRGVYITHLRRGLSLAPESELTRTAHLQIEPGRLLKEGDLMTVYVGDDGRFWIRPTDEFEDGRFEDL